MAHPLWDRMQGTQHGRLWWWWHGMTPLARKAIVWGVIAAVAVLIVAASTALT